MTLTAESIIFIRKLNSQINTKSTQNGRCEKCGYLSFWSCIFFKKTFLLHLPGRFANAFCLNIHMWAFEAYSCEERQSLRAPAEAALRCDPWHNGGTDTGGCPVLPPVASQCLLMPEHTYPHTYVPPGYSGAWPLLKFLNQILGTVPFPYILATSLYYGFQRQQQKMGSSGGMLWGWGQKSSLVQ